MANYRPGTGRPSKGPRRTVVTRLPEDIDALVVAEATARGVSKSELVAALVSRQLGRPAELPEPQPTLDTLSA